MKHVRKIIGAFALITYACLAGAAPPVVLTKDKTTVVDLTETDLVKIKNLLDCQLRLVGKAPHYKLVYSLGEIDVPTLAVKVDYDNAMYLIGVKARISGVPVNQLLVNYRSSATDEYTKELSYGCNQESTCYAEVAYEIYVNGPARAARSALLSTYGKELVLGHSDWDDIGERALMLRDRPHIVPPTPDGLPGAESKKNTIVHYVCATE